MSIDIPSMLRTEVDTSHARLIAAHLAPLNTGTFIPPADTGLLLLCFTNRCGSNYLASLLASTGTFNDAGEYFNADVVLGHARTRGLSSLRAYVSALPSIVLGGQGWLVAKVSIDQLIMLADVAILTQHPRTRYILLERQDCLGQAISRCIAAQNDRWTASQRAERCDTELIYDRAAIDLTMRDVAIANAGFRSFFAANGLVPIHLSYESVVQNPAAVIAQIGKSLNLSGLAPDLDRVTMAPQAGELNAAWRKQYDTRGILF